MINIDITKFINKHIIKRDSSLFAKDISSLENLLSDKINSKSILVIGGAGTIGSSFIKCLLNYKPSKLVVVDTNENSLTELTRDLRSTNNQYIPLDYRTYPMSYHDEVFKKMFINEKGFDIIANFAAHKHVRSEKDKYSIEAMLENNVFKAKEFLDLLLLYKPEKYFSVSTDKAANPVNVMGASKKLMEDVMMSYSSLINITTARFANVAFSNGSLLSSYIERLQKKQPISCPSDIKRFFVSPEESGQICLIACIVGISGQIFFPKLDESNLTNFKDITIDFFKELNIEILECDNELDAKKITTNFNKYPVYFFESDTSGEKLFEEFFTLDDEIDLDTLNSLGVIKNTKAKSLDEIDIIINKLKKLFDSPNYEKSDIINIITENINNFTHIETGKNLDQKM
jgi:FlaA1/EpsC-like NDP-sugar epimerase